jgi:hypothetical protein
LDAPKLDAGRFGELRHEVSPESGLGGWRSHNQTAQRARIPFRTDPPRDLELLNGVALKVVKRHCKKPHRHLTPIVPRHSLADRLDHLGALT